MASLYFILGGSSTREVTPTEEKVKSMTLQWGTSRVHYLRVNPNKETRG